MDNKLKIMNHLGKNMEQSFSMHELSNILHIPYASFYRTINLMPDLIIKENKGKATFITLNKENPITKSYLAISSEEEKKEFLAKQPIIREIAKGISDDVAILFGSYAKGKENGKSDIDIMIINKEGKKTISFSQHELIYKKKINPLFFKRSEFISMLKEKEENVGKQAIKSHIVLNNPQKFWEAVFDARA